MKSIIALFAAVFMSMCAFAQKVDDASVEKYTCYAMPCTLTNDESSVQCCVHYRYDSNEESATLEYDREFIKLLLDVYFEDKPFFKDEQFDYESFYRFPEWATNAIENLYTDCPDDAPLFSILFVTIAFE